MERRHGIAFERSGESGPVLVLLHGLGATGAVWSAFLDAAPRAWEGSVVALDLPGHGASASMAAYQPDGYAAALAPLIAKQADGQPVTLLGHSLGGVIALALADRRFELPAAAVFGLGIKALWTYEELVRLAILSRRPPRQFATEEEALGQHARMCGLEDAQPTLLRRGVAQNETGWALAMDPAALAITPPSLAELVDASPCPIHLARGDRDWMADEATLRTLDSTSVSLREAGHNAMVDQPEGVWAWLLAGPRG